MLIVILKVKKLLEHFTKKNKLDIDKLRNVLTNLSNLKSKVDKLDVDKLVPVPVDLNKLSDIVKNDIIKKDVYNTNAIEDKIPDITNLATPFFFISMTENSLQPRLCLAL